MIAEFDELKALNIWRRAIAESVRLDVPDLSARQMSLLLSVYLTSAPHTVRGLANLLKVSKPAITRAVNRITGLDMVRRKPDPDDKRSVLIQRTVRGSAFLREFGDLIVTAANENSSSRDGVLLQRY